MKKFVRLSAEIRKLEIFCYQAVKKPDEIEDKVQDYLKNYPHLRNPACIDMLRETVKLWFRIKKIEKAIDACEDNPMEMAKMIRQVNAMSKQWVMMLCNLGLTFTRQQYISKGKTAVLPPIEKLKQLSKEASERE